MAHIDDVRAERAQWAAEDSYTPDATNSVRAKSVWAIVIGLPLLIPPATPFGVFLVIMGVGLLLFSPAMASVETSAHQATVDQVSQGTGQGCGAVLCACVVATVIVIGLVLVALGAAQGVRP